MICIYHSRDLDGFTSGMLVKRKYPEAKLIGFDYGQKLPMQEIPENTPIIMVDVSIPMEEMLALAKHSGWNLTWIDHHASAINDYNKFTKNAETFVRAVLKDGIAACEIAWNYLFPEKDIPAAITLLGKYDTWRNNDQGEWNEVIMPFQYGMRHVCNSPETFPISVLDDYSEVLKVIKNGETIISYQNSQSELLCRRAAFEAEFMGLRAICLNIGGASSQVFQSVYDANKHDVMMPFFFNGKHWVYSLYTTHENIDCSMIAKQNGGGGHKKAAGFESNDFILLNSK